MSERENKNIKFINVNSSINEEQIKFTIKGEDGKIITLDNQDISVKKTAKKDIPIRDENVQEILSSTPRWMIRWGNLLFLFLVLLILFLSWLIKYPDTVSDSILITKSKDNKNYIGIITSKKYAFQKVEAGQKVHISLLVYPETENGILEGVVDTVYWNKQSKEYVSKIKLSTGLETTYGVKLNPETNLKALAKIIIKDKRLIENFFSQSNN